MNKNEVAEEFEYILEKLKTVVNLIIDTDLVEAAFVMGLLYARCEKNAVSLQKQTIRSEDR